MNKYKRFFALVYILALFISGQSFSQTILKKIQNKFNSTKDFQSNFVQSSNGKQIFKGIIKYKKKDNIRIELKNMVLVSDGKTIWNYNKKRKKIVISNVDTNNPSIFSISEIINEYPKLSKVDESKIKNGFVLKFSFLNKSEFNLSSANLFFNRKFQTNKIELNNLDGSITVLVFNNYKENNHFSNSIFKIKSSKGIETIDLR